MIYSDIAPGYRAMDNCYKYTDDDSTITCYRYTREALKNKIKTTEAVINTTNSENKYHLTTASALLNKSKNKYRKE